MQKLKPQTTIFKPKKKKKWRISHEYRSNIICYKKTEGEVNNKHIMTKE